MTWLVIGSTGFVGSGIVARLRADGEAFRTVAAPRLTAETGASAEDLVDLGHGHPATDSVAGELVGVRTVVLAAGAATPGAGWSAELVGANALLPVVVALAAVRAGVSRFIHLSSAAVQGSSAVLDESPLVRPLSAYARSKALGESGLAVCRDRWGAPVVIVRATSVQGNGRSTTSNLRRLARSPLASVAGDGTAPSSVSSLAALSDFVVRVGLSPDPPDPIVLQPWERLSTADVLRLSGGREPHHLPPTVCRGLVKLGYRASRLLGNRLVGHVRRAEAMWFGQSVRASWATEHRIDVVSTLPQVLAGTAEADESRMDEGKSL